MNATDMKPIIFAAIGFCARTVHSRTNVATAVTYPPIDKSSFRPCPKVPKIVAKSSPAVSFILYSSKNRRITIKYAIQ